MFWQMRNYDYTGLYCRTVKQKVTVKCFHFVYTQCLHLILEELGLYIQDLWNTFFAELLRNARLKSRGPNSTSYWFSKLRVNYSQFSKIKISLVHCILMMLILPGRERFQGLSWHLLVIASSPLSFAYL